VLVLTCCVKSVNTSKFRPLYLLIVILLAAGASLLLLFGSWWWDNFGLAMPPTPAPISTPDDSFTLSPTGTTTPIPYATVFLPDILQQADDALSDYVPPTATSTPTPVQWLFSEDPWGPMLCCGNTIDLRFNIEGGTITSNPFNVWVYEQGIFDTYKFDPDKGNSVIWDDGRGRWFLWVHSGPDHSMTPIQQWLERDEHGNTVGAYVTDERIDNLLGDGAYMGDLSHVDADNHATIVAAVRVSPDLVKEMNLHVGDLPEWLDQEFPMAGFGSSMDARPILYITFCGRALAGEEPDPLSAYWQQARYVIGVIPNE